MLLGNAGLDPQASRRCLDSRRLYWRRHFERDLPQPWYSWEAIEIVFDTAETSYRRILEYFFQIHDPTTRNRQGNDIGTSYRSAIFYTSDEQRMVAEETIADVNASGLWPGKVVTEVTPVSEFLGSRTGAPRLSGALSERLHLSLPSSQLGPSQAADRWQVHANCCSCWRGCSVLERCTA